MTTTSSSSANIDSLYSRWHINKREANFIKRSGMRILEVVVVAAAMLLIPTVIQQFVHSVDEVYELLGRTAQSPYTAISWPSIFVAVLLLLSWHAFLGRLSYSVILEEESTKESENNGKLDEDGQGKASKKRGISWGRVLGRVVIPLFLLSFAAQFAYQLQRSFASPKPLVTPNTVNIKEEDMLANRIR